MPDFLGTLTPKVAVKPVTIVFKGADGNTKRTTFSPPADSGYSSAQLSALVQALGALSNAGVVRYRGAGETTAIDESNYLWNDDLYSVSNVCTLKFVGNDQVSEVNIGLPGPKLRFMRGRVLADPDDELLVQTMVAAALAVLNGGAVTYRFAGGKLPKTKKLRTVTDPTDDTPV